MRLIKPVIFLFTCISLCYFSACSKKNNEPVLFQVLTDNTTGLTFSNTLTPTENFNMFNYMYFYNGAGVGAGDFNNDGKIDLFFASNQGDNKIFLNKGDLKFTDVTLAAEIPQDHGWSTGVSVVDINNDGLLDIYICKVGSFGTARSKNQLLVCQGIRNGIPYYKDEAHQYGLDFSGFSTQAVFFDYDKDGDLDMFLLNHTIHQNGSFASRDHFIGTYDSLSGDRLYRNEGNHFTEVTRQSKINSSSIGYGLGVAVADIDLDGWPDLYIGNDFHENDYLYINKKNGTFEDQNNQRLMHTSKYSMGVDIADVNNDGFPEIVSMDMLPYDSKILKRSFGDDDYDVFYDKIKAGYNYQYSRNNLQLNRKNGLFSEVGVYSGVYATDWSWSALLMDFNNDGLKDLFISNGIPKRLNDMDYINFISGEEMQQRLANNDIKSIDMALLNKFPEIKIPSKFYQNQGNMVFKDMENSIGNPVSSYSNGAVYADLDNDGDLDIVVNNINGPALLYENKTVVKPGKRNSIDISLTGPALNKNALGTKVVVFANGGIRTYEKYPVKGFMSSMEIPIQIGLDHINIDSTFLVWPDNSFQKINLKTTKNTLHYRYITGLPKFNYSIITDFKKNLTKPAHYITGRIGLAYKHTENAFQEFDRQPLMSHMLSAEGPALAVGDINHDGFDDVFIGASKGYHNAVFTQQQNGKFNQLNQPDLRADSMYEDIDAVWADVNNDGHADLIIASGGDEWYGNDEHLLPRVYLNDGKGILKRSPAGLTNEFVNASCVVPLDFNNDGFIDLFIGGRSVPNRYGETPRSYLLKNDGHGKFSDVTDSYAPGLSKLGMVTGAIWADLNKDHKKDLTVSCEWGLITTFINEGNSLKKKDLITKKGWWNFLYPVDLNNDGNIDLIAGNLGLNSRLHASEKEPLRLYLNDFNGNGGLQQVMSYYLQGKEIPFASKEELERQIPELRKKFLYAGDFSTAIFSELFSQEKLNSSQILTATYMANAVLINHGNWNFSLEPLPWQAQLSPFRDAISVNALDDQNCVLLAGNFYSNDIHQGRYDADFGTLLTFNHNKLQIESLNGLAIKGEVRHIKSIMIAGKQAYILSKNNDSTVIIQF